MTRNRYILILAILITLMSATFSAHAQDDQRPSWCPLPETTPVPESPVNLEDDLLTFQINTDDPIVLDDSGIVSEFALSPDQSQIAIVRLDADYNSELVVMHTDGTNERQLLSPDDMTSLRTDEIEGVKTGMVNIQFLNANTLIFNSYLHNTTEDLFLFFTDDLLLINIETAEVTTLVPEGEGGEYLVSPDGNWIAVTTYDSLHLISPDGTHNQMDVLPTYRTILIGHHYFNPPMMWSTDSNELYIAIATSDDPYSEQDGPVTLWSVPTDGIEPTEQAIFTAYYLSFTLSPDVEFVSFSKIDSPLSNNYTLVIAHLDGSEEYTFLTGENVEFRRWTSEYGHFVFTDENRVLKLGNICGQQESLPASN